MFRHIRLANKPIKNFQKLKKLPNKTPNNQKSKKEYSSELILKTKNVQPER